MNKSKLKASLYMAIDKWIEDECESEEWERMDVYWGEETTNLITEIVFSIILACAESQQYRDENLRRHKNA